MVNFISNSSFFDFWGRKEKFFAGKIFSLLPQLFFRICKTMFCMDFNQIQELIRMMSKYKLSEFSLKEGDFKLVIRNQSATEAAVPQTVVVAPVTPPVAAPPLVAPAAPAKTETAPAPPGEDVNAQYKQIKSPMVGTFYRSPGPEKPPFVKIGDSVDVGTKVCIIEAMKLFNEIESEIKGKIVKILVEDASPVEYDQPLFLVEA